MSASVRFRQLDYVLRRLGRLVFAAVPLLVAALALLAASAPAIGVGRLDAKEVLRG